MCGSTSTETEHLTPDTTLPKEPKFKPGQRIHDDGWIQRGTVIRVVFAYEVEDDDNPGETELKSENDLSLLAENTDDAWVEATLLLHRLIETGNFSKYSRTDNSQLRHRAYQLLGAHGVTITEELRGEEGKVQAIIDRLYDQKQ